MNMNSFLIFVVFLQVLIPLGTSCRTSNGEEGACKAPSECKSSQTLARCPNRPYVCCPRKDPNFPTNCGNTPMYPRAQIVNGAPAKPTEYSWLASLRYRDPNIYRFCAASVINSLYLLTAAHCVTGDAVTEAGGLIGVRLGKFDDNGNMCDYGTEGCRHYEEYGIEKTIPHTNFIITDDYVGNDIALIRVNRSIQFTDSMLPICLPFGRNYIVAPSMNSVLIATGWGPTSYDDDSGGKRDVGNSLCERNKCAAFFPVDETHLCTFEAGQNICKGDSGGPLMWQFARRRLVLEGIVSNGIKNCNKTSVRVYTRVRSYGAWLRAQIEM